MSVVDPLSKPVSAIAMISPAPSPPLLGIAAGTRRIPRAMLLSSLRGNLLDAAHLVERRDVGEMAHFQRHAYLVGARDDVVEMHMRRFGNLLAAAFTPTLRWRRRRRSHWCDQRSRFAASARDAATPPVEYPDFAAPARSSRCPDKVCPCHERQFPDLVEPGRRKVTYDGAARDGFQDLGSRLGKLLSALGVERLVGLHDDVVGIPRIRMIQRQRRSFRVRSGRIDCDDVDRDLRDGRSTLPD